MQDMGDVTLDAREIVKKSYEIVKRFVSGESYEEKVLQRCVIATGDPTIKDVIVFKHDPVRKGIEAIKEGANIICDVKMVEAGINKRKIRSNVFVAVDHANDGKMTRAMSGIFNLKKEIKDSIVAIGNAPTSAIAVYELVRSGIKPALIIATPVGFVNAAESKEMIRSLDVPSITTVGTRGGSTLCVAILNAIINLAYERPD